MVEKRGMGATHVKICVRNNNGMINGAINIRVVPLLLLLVPWGVGTWGLVPGMGRVPLLLLAPERLGGYHGVGAWNRVSTIGARLCFIDGHTFVVGTRMAGWVPWGWCHKNGVGTLVVVGTRAAGWVPFMGRF